MPLIVAARASSGTCWRVRQARLIARKAPSDHGGMERAEWTIGNRTFDAPRWRVRGTSSHATGSAVSNHGRRPWHFLICTRANLPNAPSIVRGGTPQSHEMTMSRSDAVLPSARIDIRWALAFDLGWPW